GEKTENPLAMYLSDVFTIPSDLSGTPAISIPCGLAAEDGLPVGFQLMGRLEDERTVLRAAYALEQDLAFDARPPLVATAARRRRGGRHCRPGGRRLRGRSA